MGIGSVTATSALMLPLHNLADMIAASATFQARVNKSAAGILADHIWLSEVKAGEGESEEELACHRPFVMLCYDTNGWIEFAHGTRVYLKQTGGIAVFITASATYTESVDHPADSETDYGNFAGGIIEDVAELSGQDNNWPFRSIEMAERPQRTELKRRKSDDFWFSLWIFKYGLG